MSRFIDAYRGRFGVEPICRVLGVSASAYYQRRTGERSRRVVEDEWLRLEIERVHAANWDCYGYRRTWLQLKREGIRVGRDRIKRLMRAGGIQGAKRRGKPWRTTRPDPAALRAPDRVERDFSAEREELKRLHGEVRELRRANEILKAASVFFAKELDGTPRR